MKKLRSLFNNYYFNFGLIIFFTVVVFYFTLSGNVQKVIIALQEINFFWLAIVILLTLLVQLFIGIVLKVLANITNPDYNVGQGFVNALTASLFHAITPSASGGQIAQIYVYRKQGVKISDSISILLMDFILYQVVLVSISLLFLVLKFQFILTNYQGTIWLLVLGFIWDGFFVVMLFVLSGSPKIYTWVTHSGLKLLVSLHIIKDQAKALEKLNESLMSFRLAWLEITKYKIAMIQVILLNILRLLTYYAIPFFVFLTLGITVSWELFFDILILTSFVSMINHLVPIPGAAGTTEATFIILMTPVVGYISAVTGSIIWRFATFHLLILVSAIIFFFFKRFHDTSHKEKKI